MILIADCSNHDNLVVFVVGVTRSTLPKCGHVALYKHAMYKLATKANPHGSIIAFGLDLAVVTLH